MSNTFKYPVALRKDDKKLVEANEVESGLECNCYCKFCNEDLIAVNKDGNKQRPHFRHQAESNCDSKLETYIHWLSIELFKEMDSFFLPEITYQDLNELDYSNSGITNKIRDRLINLLDRYILDEELQNPFLENKIIRESASVDIEGCNTEVTHKSSEGIIRVDVEISSRGQKLFIEPYNTNDIDCNKLNKIIEIGNSVISIRLRTFMEKAVKKNHYYTKEELKNFLVSGESKQWVYIKQEKIEPIINSYLNKIESSLKSSIEKYNSINELTKIRNLKNQERNNLDIEMSEIEKKINQQKKQL